MERLPVGPFLPYRIRVSKALAVECAWAFAQKSCAQNKFCLFHCAEHFSEPLNLKNKK